jgi:trans-2,3-dihydro-3-hydroxyanthranilate isomerase
MPETIELLSAFDPFGAEGAGTRRRYVLLDVFAEAPLQGNQLAVLTDARGIETETMQSIARELKLSETVFVLPPEEGGDVRVRIFTPAAELPFAGHPVLGSAVIAARALGRSEVVLETGSGHVAVEVLVEGALAASGRMRQPIPTWEAFDRESQLLAALGVERSRMPVEVYCNGPRHVLVGLASPQAVAELEPDVAGLAALGEIGVSCFASAGESWKTRMFAPGLGVPEDPATGSAAGPLAVHLARHARIAFGMEIEISQGVEMDRPSLLRARVVGTDDRIESVEVGGRAVVIGRGELQLP